MTEEIEIPTSFPRGADVTGKRVVITGAGRGIGLAAAAALAEAGALVTQCARSLPEISSAAVAIRAQGGRADILQLDRSRRGGKNDSGSRAVPDLAE